jgi:hypothetical protein
MDTTVLIVIGIIVILLYLSHKAPSTEGFTSSRTIPPVKKVGTLEVIEVTRPGFGKMNLPVTRPNEPYLYDFDSQGKPVTYGPYHFGSKGSCDKDRKTAIDPNMKVLVSNSTVCSAIGGEVGRKVNGLIECDRYRVCANPPGPDDMMIGNYGTTNYKTGDIIIPDLSLSQKECVSVGGIWDRGCKFSLYRKNALPKGAFIAPGAMGARLPNLKKFKYARTSPMPSSDCRYLGGAWNAGYNRDTAADCHFDWYTTFR